VALTSRDDGAVVQLTGSVVENPHGSHLNTFRFPPKARQIVCSKIIGRPQTGQMTSFVDVSSLIGALWWTRALTQITTYVGFPNSRTTDRAWVPTRRK
jgi:hypothetical protein